MEKQVCIRLSYKVKSKRRRMGNIKIDLRETGWEDRAIAQAVSRRLPTAAVRVQIRVWSCGIL
jgi:hypothetical protein